MTQAEMFPRTTMEILEGLAEVHRDEYNKAAKALGDLNDDEKIARRYEKAEERVTKSRDQVQAIDMLIRRERERSPAEVAVEIVNSGALDTDGLTVLASVSPAAYPLTGEVTGRGGEVLVAWPDNPDLQRIEVGPLTRYGNLAAKFLNSLPGDDPRREDSILDYRVVDVDAGSERDPDATIVAADYGLAFSVKAGAKAEESTA